MGELTIAMWREGEEIERRASFGYLSKGRLRNLSIVTRQRYHVAGLLCSVECSENRGCVRPPRLLNAAQLDRLEAYSPRAFLGPLYLSIPLPAEPARKRTP
jgi:hypothetical protein